MLLHSLKCSSRNEIGSDSASFCRQGFLCQNTLFLRNNVPVSVEQTNSLPRMGFQRVRNRKSLKFVYLSLKASRVCYAPYPFIPVTVIWDEFASSVRRIFVGGGDACIRCSSRNYISVFPTLPFSHTQSEFGIGCGGGKTPKDSGVRQEMATFLFIFFLKDFRIV